MITTAIEIEAKVDELSDVLDIDIRHLQESLSRLNELRQLVIKRDEASLAQLLASIQNEVDNYKSNESKRQSIRKYLANALGCSTKQMTLSRLEALLPVEKKYLITERKAILRSLTEKLRKEHLSTALLLSDCARFNNLLLENLFELGRTSDITYNSNGTSKRQADIPFVNLRF